MLETGTYHYTLSREGDEERDTGEQDGRGEK